ncbi:IS1182 family transposase [Anaerospora hongkongensis]|uniref:IS1182 family transposase n=1 Tax=Anaerospora hongkongensis TaxID=244830 RepID=UPI002FDAA2F6
MAYIVGADRYQTRMITTSLDDLIDNDNSVRVIDSYVDSLDLENLGFTEYSGTNKGQSPYRRSDLLKLHIYGYLNKIRSSRALETEAKRNLELMWLINTITPDHGTIAGFVQKNKKAFHNTLRNLTLILKGWGLIDGRLVAIDGTKIRAQNSKHNCITQSGLDKKIEYADAQINSYLMAISKDDTCADDFKEKLKTYQELKEKYIVQKQELKDNGLEQKSLTDPDSKRMKNNGALDICYNIQSVVDSQNHFVVDISTTNDINDQNQLYVMAKNASEILEIESFTVIADTGCCNGAEIKNCIDDGMNVYIKKAKANNATKDNEFRKEKFTYDREADEYTCPAGNRLSFFENTSKNSMKYRKYKCSDCHSCKHKNVCTTSSSGRTIQRWEHEHILETVYQETLNNNETYKQRRCIVEHPFGTIKRSLGYSYFLRRRKDSVDAEAASMFIAYNFKRLLSMFSTQELLMKFE